MPESIVEECVRCVMEAVFWLLRRKGRPVWVTLLIWLALMAGGIWVVYLLFNWGGA